MRRSACATLPGPWASNRLQLYRLKLSKADILAEVIITLNQEQIAQIPELCRRAQGKTLHERCCAYLRELYAMDIYYLPIRSVGAAFGWVWNTRLRAADRRSGTCSCCNRSSTG